MALIEADWWLYIAIAIGVIILLAVNGYILVIYQHPDDKNEAYWPKCLVILGMITAQGAILFLPLDVANNSANVDCNQSWSDVFCGALDMTLAWNIIFMTIFVLAMFLIPYTIFFYEEDDTAVLEGAFDFRKTCVTATKYMGCVVIIVALTLALTFIFLGITSIPVNEYVAVALDDFEAFAVTSSNGVSDPLVVGTPAITAFAKEEVSLQVDFPLYVIALLSFVGWFLFMFFAGLGLSAIPIDLIRSFTNKPQRLDRGQLAALEISIQRRCNELIELGELLKSEREEASRAAQEGSDGFLARRRRNKRDANEFNKFKQMVYIIEEDYNQMVECRDYARKFNPLRPIIALAMGVVCLVISLLWILHIILYMLLSPPATPFLNEYLMLLDNFFPLFGILTLAILCLYLLAATIKGCFKFGLRLVWFTLHPMKPNGTYMNSFLFNVGIVLMCTPAVLQFITQAFADYTSNAKINNFFNVQVRYLRFFSYFYANNVFVIALLLVALLGGIWLALRPNDLPANPKEVKEALLKMEQHNERMAGGDSTRQ